MKSRCEVGGCERAVHAYGHCKFHWRRKAAGQPLNAPPRKLNVNVRCVVDGCDEPYHAKGRCQFHYLRARDGVDDVKPRQSVCAEGTRRVDYHGYMRIKVGEKWVLEHRHKMSRKLGRPMLRAETVHHKNGDKLDNRLSNLELWSKSQPYGQRVVDKVRWAKELLRVYEPEALRA